MNSPTIRVLLVDDSPTDGELIQQQLMQITEFTFVVETSDRLADGLQRLSHGGIDVLVLDLNLPDSTGIETLAAARSRSVEVPIVVLTGLDDEQLGLAAIQQGADDYCSKSLINTDSLARRLIFAIERKRAQHNDQQLEMARSIQQRLFPDRAPPLAGFEIAAACHPAETTSGDYFDYLSLPDGSLGVVIADVSGHGFGPALLMAETRAYLRALSRTNTNVGEIVTMVNRIIVEDTAATQFITLFFLRLDRQGPCFTYTGAGHAGLHFNASGKMRPLMSTALPLAVNSNTSYKHSKPIPLQSGEILVVTTDGIIESRDASGELFGNDRCADVVRQHRAESADEIVAALYDSARDFSGNRTQADDMTVAVIKVL